MLATVKAEKNKTQAPATAIAGRLRAALNMGIVFRHLGQVEAATKNLNLALQMARREGNFDMEMQAYCNLGILSRDLGDYDESMKVRKRLPAIVMHSYAHWFLRVQNLQRALKVCMRDRNDRINDDTARIYSDIGN